MGEKSKRAGGKTAFLLFAFMQVIGWQKINTEQKFGFSIHFSSYLLQ